MKAIRKIFKLLSFVTWVGGWALAASALHVVRASDSASAGEKVVIIPKDRLHFRQTYVDMRNWSAADAANHPQFAARLTAAGKGDLITNLPLARETSASNAPTADTNSSLVVANPAPTTTPAQQSNSIFD